MLSANIIRIITALCLVAATRGFQPRARRITSICSLPQNKLVVSAPLRAEVFDNAVDVDDDLEADHEEVDILMDGSPDDLLLDDKAEDSLDKIDISQFGPPRPYINQQAILAAREKWRRHETDTGSPEYQIAVAHERIKYLTAHLQRHPKDYASRRGLIAIVNKRRRFLNYLYREDPARAMEMVQELGVRFKPPDAVMTRAEKYAVYNSRSRKK